MRLRTDIGIAAGSTAPGSAARAVVSGEFAGNVSSSRTASLARLRSCALRALPIDGAWNNEEQVPQAKTPAAPADAGKTPVEKLRGWGVRGILMQLAKDGQIIDVRCEMPQCYCFRGRRHFDPISPGADWMPTADHYPRLKMHGGHLTPDNVRLAHRVCNQRDYLWRKKINVMLGKRMSLAEIAEKLNVEKVPTIHGTNRWTAASVRKAFVS
ncbi:MAG TPA: hypothetical protein VLZ06_13050 [Solirubrobacteraceae bacterium]|nr:hypothetical protein [Solirubrobacteraceae bacterium]